MTQYIKKLPAVFQTVTEKKFFDATFDQVFSKKDSDLLSGFIGRRDPGLYDPVSDFYIPEPTKNRTWWQLEATAYARNPDNTKSNIFFYDDLLNRINYYGGNTLNQDRLFESEYYSWAPPIDFDMFTNYYNYYWLEQGLVPINVTGMTDNQIDTLIVGQTSFNTNQLNPVTDPVTPPTVLPNNLNFTTGIRVIFVDSVKYPNPMIVENIGGSTGIRLVPHFPDYTPGTIVEFLPWSGSVQLTNGRVITDTNWDTVTWDTQPQPGNGDYITIERGSVDRNAWSRTNNWYHVEAINETVSATGTAFPIGASRALRPIIQFSADLGLFKSGTQFNSDISFGFRDNADGISPLLLTDYQGLVKHEIDTQLGISIQDNQLVMFMNDSGPLLDAIPWDDLVVNEDWDILSWAVAAGDPTFIVNEHIFRVSIDPNTSVVTFVPNPATIVTGDIVFAYEDAPYDGVQRGETWYYDGNAWVQAVNDKVSINQAPLFQLYDHNDIPLDDVVTYPDSTFAGSKIFSYKVNGTPGATVDPVLKFPIVYVSLGQSSDIMFQNDLITDRYVYSAERLPISGYYYYKFVNSPIMYNNWNLFEPAPPAENLPTGPDSLAISKQRVIDKFVAGYGTEYQFKLSVTPYGFPANPDIIVSVNGVEVKTNLQQANGYYIVSVNNSIYIDLETYLNELLATPIYQAPVVEITTYTQEILDATQPGYFQIPQQLEANPSQLEVGEISASDLIQQFTSIIGNQVGLVGSSFGGYNNYRDTRKNRSIGSFILQNVTPLLKTMLVSSNNDLDVIAGIRFSQQEYTKFKNKYLQTALRLINEEFNPVQYHDNSVVISAWVDTIIKTINVSKEFSKAFAYSYMIANGTPYATEQHIVPPSGDLTLSTYLDLNDPRSALYIYDVTGQETLLLIGRDYEIVSTNLAIDIKFSAPIIGKNIYVAFYTNPVPAYIPAYVPSTPTKIGAYNTFIPRIEFDTSYTVPTNVIIGHDGSKTIAYNDYRDALLLELEKRIYNLLTYKFRNEYAPPVRLENVKSGYFRTTRYTRAEYLSITESFLNKWSASNRANYYVNDWAYTSASLPSGSPELWKLYNYATAVTPGGTKLNLPGNWKGIFQYYYDTIFPDTRPWEMLGFSSMPIWWIDQYGSDWSAVNSALWSDLELGMIRQGPTAIFDPISLLPQPQAMWARPGLSAIIPVDASGNIIPVPTLFNVAMSGNPYAPFDGFDNAWDYGDGGPVEQAWMSTSDYTFSVQEFLYLMNPAKFGELLFDTIGTELSPGTIDIPGVYGPVQSTTNWQYVQNDTFTNADPLFAWMRPKNSTQVVHAESVDSSIQVRYGYQRWISDRLLFLGKDVSATFGEKIRTLDVNLANKFGGFTNKDTISAYMESVSPGAATTSLLVPTNNFNVILHTGQPIKTYSYSGVIIRISDEGKFIIYGYDLLNSAFTVLNRSDAKLVDVTIGGTPAEFKIYEIGQTYYAGEIVRYNGIYYSCLGVSTANTASGKFNPKNWQKLKSLPMVGGVSVVYRPISEVTSYTLPYGAILDTPQDVFDFLIGWGAYLETQGWKFDEVSDVTNQVTDWLYSAKQFLFWINTDWSANSTIQLSPAANNAVLTVAAGYPNDVESISNGVYSILDKYGVAIPPSGTTTDREGRGISVAPVDLTNGGIYFLQVSASETEHVLIFDNSTSFSDIIYDPLLRVRQQRLKFNGSRSNNWYGKKEAAGYLIIDNQLVPNYDTIVDSMRYFYDSNVTLDNPSIENLGKHLIGYESKSYLDNLQISNDVQYMFYQGAIRQKGTKQAFDKLFRSNKVLTNETIEVYEEWALKLSDLGNTVEQVKTEFILTPEQNSGEVIVARLNFMPSYIGGVKEINILNAQNRYINVPSIVISLPDADPNDPLLFYTYDRYDDLDHWDTMMWDSSNLIEPLRQAKAYAILDARGVISRIDMTDSGYGYLSAPIVSIESGTESNHLDSLYAVWQGRIAHDTVADNIVDIDIDDTSKWVVRPPDPQHSLEFPTTDIIDYDMPNAGYVNFNDVKWTSFASDRTELDWGSELLNPIENDTVWIAKTFTEDWDVYKLVNLRESPWQANPWQIIDHAGSLLLLTNRITTSSIDIMAPSDASASCEITTGGVLIGANIVNGGTGYNYTPSINVVGECISQATVTATIANNVVVNIAIVNGGSGYATPPDISIVGTHIDMATAEAVVVDGVITQVNVTYGGSGYTTTPTVVITPKPISTAIVQAHVSGGIIVGTTIIDGGSGYATPPEISVGLPLSETAKIEITVADGVISHINLVSGGAGYTSTPTIEIVGDCQVVATAYAVMTAGVVTDILLDNPGEGYITLPDILIIGENTVPAVAVPTIVDGAITSARVTDVGSGYDTIPAITVTGASTSPAILTASIYGGIVTDVTITSSGSGYVTWPTVTVAPPSPVSAQLVASIEKGVVVEVIIVDPGAGLAMAPSVTVADPVIVEATLAAVVADGVINKLTITDGGSGYTTPPVLQVIGNSVTAAVLSTVIADGVLTSIKITNRGGYYAIPPDVSVMGDCAIPAKVEAIIEYGVIKEFKILSGGTGYQSNPSLVIQSATSAFVGNDAYLYPVVDSNGYIASVTIVQAGEGYSTANVLVPTRAMKTAVGFVDAEFQITEVSATGAILAVEVIVHGTGYQSVENQELFPQLSVSSNGRTDYGNMICLQTRGNRSTIPTSNHAVCFESAGLYIDPITLITYHSYRLTNLAGTPIVSNDMGDYASFTDLLLFKSMRFAVTPTSVSLPKYVGINDLIWVDDVAGKWAVMRVTGPEGYWDISFYDPFVNEFWGFPGTYMYGWGINGPLKLTTIRTQEKLINTHFFDGSQVYQSSTANELVMLPVYDPFKAILPGPAKQNLSYISMRDPARYNVTGDLRLFSDNVTFAEAQVGKLWWDTSEMRYTYYEQPMALDGSETVTDNLVYRRDRWGQQFPGGTIMIYEWVKSRVPPEQYTGTGTPRSTTDWVQVFTSNRFTNITETNYYFWVLNATDKPTIENRTFAAFEVAQLLNSPRSQGFVFYSPIQQTAINNSYMFYNVQEILAYKGDNIQIQYRLGDRDDQAHAQWKLFREGDTASLITDQFWNKLVDSICAYTKLLPASDEWNNDLIYGKNLPWDIYGWDVAPWDDAVEGNINGTVSPIYGELLPVPDPSLSEYEKFGVTYRPRQGMFRNLAMARQILVQSANKLLGTIPAKDKIPDWNVAVPTSIYWDYTTWFETGYENVTPSVVFSTLALAQTVLSEGSLNTGAVIEVIDGTPDGRYALYVVEQLDPYVETQSFRKVAIDKSAIRLLDTVYTEKNVYALSVELREIMNALRTQVFIDEYIVYQNELYFSMLNFVISEQKNVDWAFKSSYIYIKENNIPIQQNRLYTPDQIDNVMGYIMDSKPYHTQVRDYSSSHLISDIAVGTASVTFNSKEILQFGPDYGGPYEESGWDVDCSNPADPSSWDTLAWGVCPDNYALIVDPVIAGSDPWNPGYPADVNLISWDGPAVDAAVWDIEGHSRQNWDLFVWDPTSVAPQMISREDVYTLPLTNFDPAKIGMSQLFPYTFDFTSINLNNPQTFITPQSVVSVLVGEEILLYGKDYYVDYNTDTDNYTAYFFKNMSSGPVPTAMVFWNGGGMQYFRYGTNRTEIGYGFPKGDFVVNVDTRLPVIDLGSGIYQPINNMWDTGITAVDEIIGAGQSSFDTVVWDQDNFTNVVNLSEYNGNITVLSYKENLNEQIGPNFYRNAEIESGTLAKDLPAPTNNLSTIEIYVDPLTHPSGTDILPDPDVSSPAIWVNGERIEYKIKTYLDNNTWLLSDLRRGTMGTAPNSHLALIPSLDDPSVLVPNPVWIEKDNVLDFRNQQIEIEIGWDTGPFDSAGWDIDPYIGGKYDMDRFESAPWDNNDYTRLFRNYKVSVDTTVWNALDPLPDPSTGVDGWDQMEWEFGAWEKTGVYTSIMSAVPLWYATTPESQFLQAKPGISTP